MFWYIGGVLAGFAIGYVVATAQTRKRGRYKKGESDCKSCKYLNYITAYGTVYCKKNLNLSAIPMACSKYRRIKDINNEEGISSGH